MGRHQAADVYGKNCDFDKVAESWELSTHPPGESSLAGGDHPGLTLSQYFQQFPGSPGEKRPGLQGLPGAHQAHRRQGPSSIQVHPSDEYALRGGRRSTARRRCGSSWTVSPGRFSYFGVNRPVSKEEFQQRIENNTVLEVLNKVEVRRGMCSSSSPAPSTPSGRAS